MLFLKFFCHWEMSEKKLKKRWRPLLTILRNRKKIKLSPGGLQLQRSQTKQFTAIRGVLPTLWSHSALILWNPYYLVNGHLVLFWWWCRRQHEGYSTSVTAILTAWGLSSLFSKAGKYPCLEGWRQLLESSLHHYGRWI